MSQPSEPEHEIDIAMRAALVFAGITAESIAQAGDAVTPPQLRVLVLASIRDNLNTTAVAEALDIHLSNASRVCDRLINAGLLNRRDSSIDRRNVELSLTEEGERLVASVLRHRRATFTRILRRMSGEDRAALARALQFFSEAAEEYG